MVGKSLLRRTPAGRYELHNLLRQYASEKLAKNSQDDTQAHDLHSVYFCNAMVAWKESIFATQKQPQIMEVLNADLDNAIAAWNWSLDHEQIEKLDQAIETIALFFWRRVRFVEGISLFSTARHALIGCSTPQACHLQARLHAWEGTFDRLQRNFKKAERHFLETLSLLEDSEIDQEAALEDRALAHWGLGDIAFQTGDAERSKTEYEISLKLFQELSMPYYEAEVLLELAGLTAFLIWDARVAEEYWKTSLEIKKSLGDQLSVAGILYERAVIAAYHIGDIEKATALFQESSEILEQFGDLASKAQSLRCQAQVAHLNARFQESHELWQKQLPIYEELGNRNGISWTYTNLGLTHKSLGNYAQAEEHIRRALKVLESNPEEDIQIGIARWSLGNVLLVRGRVSEAITVIEMSLKIDRRMTGKHNLGRDLSSLSLAEFLLGDKESAWTHILEAIELFLQYQHYDWMVFAASTLAVLLADQGDTERGLTLYGLTTCYPEAAASRFFEDAYWHHVHEPAADMPPDRVEKAIAQGRQLDIWEYAQELLGELKSRHA
jgi:tetratricopeptide (TPR) repeat protein